MTEGAASPSPWWRESVVYQVYVRSFADGDGDGTGDVAGLRSRLPYLAELGVDAIWVNPWYRSPLLDGGYDVADYRDIDPRYGTLSDAEAMIADAHALGIRVLVDLVPNHTSWEHAWFEEAVAAAPGHPSRARYHIRPGQGPDGDAPPSDWVAVFGGSAWKRLDDGEWYLHLFDISQPDLNWDLEEVRAEFDDILRFWLDRGADGFRIDVAHGMVKDTTYPSVRQRTKLLGTTKTANHPHWDRDGVHEINRRWRAVLDAHGDDHVMVAEAWVDADRLPLYVRPDEYHQAFTFSLLSAEWSRDDMVEAITDAVQGVGAVGNVPCWTLSNHDVMRHATRYGLPPGTDWRQWPMDGPADLLDRDLGLRRARAAVMMLLALPGSVYLYQGEELGLHEVWDLPTDVLDDPVWERSGHRSKGRDGCRVPLPWTVDGPSFGFGSGAPWLPQPADWGACSAEAQRGVDASMLELYRRLLELRRDRVVGDVGFAWVDMGSDVLAFARGRGVTCVVNFGSQPVDLPAGAVLASSVPLEAGRLGTDAAAWISSS